MYLIIIDEDLHNKKSHFTYTLLVITQQIPNDFEPVICHQTYLELIYLVDLYYFPSKMQIWMLIYFIRPNKTVHYELSGIIKTHVCDKNFSQTADSC